MLALPSTDRMSARVTVVVSGRTQTASVERKGALYDRLLAIEDRGDVSTIFADG